MISQKPNIKINDLSALDIRVCEVLEAERVPNTDKLLKLKIDTGIDQRECVTNLGAIHSPTEFIGKRIPFIINLEPVKIRGVFSTAMIFAPKQEDVQFQAFAGYGIGDSVYVD